jgi:hypothetical protein
MKQMYFTVFWLQATFFLLYCDSVSHLLHVFNVMEMEYKHNIKITNIQAFLHSSNSCVATFLIRCVNKETNQIKIHFTPITFTVTLYPNFLYKCFGSIVSPRNCRML